jgi:hypothetical protein
LAFPCRTDDHILLHAGDFTSLGRVEHALEFNEWLGTLHYRHKFIISGMTRTRTTAHASHR